MRILARRLPSFEYSRKKGRFSGWLRTVANHEVNRLLRRRRPGHADTSVLRSVRVKGRDESTAWETIWLREHLRYCLSAVREEIAPTTFEAFRRAALEEQPVPDVCATLGLNRNQVYLAKSRVLRRLKEKMTELVGFEV